MSVQGRQGLHGRHRHQREPGRRLGFDRHLARRQADAHCRRRSPPRAGRDGRGEARCSGRQAHPTRRLVQAKANPAKKVWYAELIGGRYFNVELAWNKQFGNTLYAPGKAEPKKPSEHKIVGQPIKREDIAPKVFAQEDFVTDMKVPGMVHGRMIRPAVAGACR